MNLGQFLHELGVIFHLVHGNDTTTTALTTHGLKGSTTPMIIDTSSISPYTSSDISKISSKFLSSLSTDSVTRTTKNLEIFSDVDESTYRPTASSHGTESTVSSTVVHTSSGSPVTTHHSSSVPSVSSTVVHTSTGSPATTHHSSSVPSVSSTVVHTSTGSPVTSGHSSSVTTVVTSEGTASEADTSPTGNGTASESVTTDNSTVSEPVTTDNSTVSEPVTTDNSTHTGTTDNTTVTDSTGSDKTTVSGNTEVTPTSSEVTPTEKPGLTKGAVAGIVVGSLLAVAIIAAAIVFVLKQKNSPEHRRLNV